MRIKEKVWNKNVSNLMKQAKIKNIAKPVK